MKYLGPNSTNSVRGFIATPSGAKIPAIVEFKRVKHPQNYAQVGKVPIPAAWLDEFEESSRSFYFRTESGEYFTQYNVFEAVSDPQDGEAATGRLILLREQDALAAE